MEFISLNEIKTLNITIILIILFIITIIIFLVLKWLVRKILRTIFYRPKKRFKKKKKFFLSVAIKSKADRKYAKILAEFKKKHKRKPSKDELIKIVVTASHHTFPVKGKNVRKWTIGKKGHWNRQKVRKYLLEKHKIIKNYKMG